MPRHLDTESRTDAIVATVSHLIRAGGMAAVTTRAIAAGTGISMASLAHHLTNRQRLMRVVAYRTGRDFLSETVGRRYDEGVLALLPSEAEGLADTRVWLAWCELARSDELVAGEVAAVTKDERYLIRSFLSSETSRGDVGGAPLSNDTVDTFVAVVHGLRHAVCATVDPMPLAHARELLSRASAQALVADAALARNSLTMWSGSAAE